MPRPMRHTIASLGFLFMAGCAPMTTDVGGANQRIIGGTNDTADPSVVLMIAQVSGQQGASLCTGEVVSPHVILTAAHCVDPDVVGTGNTFYIYTGNDINTVAPDATNT